MRYISDNRIILLPYGITQLKMDNIWRECKSASKNALRSLMSIYETESRRTDKDYVYRTLEDFKRCPSNVPKMIVIGCTGAGKSTLLNIFAGNRYSQCTDFTWKWSETPLFKATHGCNAVTQAASYANIDWFGNEAKPLVVVDTPGHDDTEGRNMENKHSRDTLKEQAADLHNKLKAMESLNTILVLHNQVSSNRLNPATYAILQMVNEKFGPTIWKNVVVAYSQCNNHTEASWKSEIEQKSRDMQQEIRNQFSGCTVDVPIIALGGGVDEHDYTTDVEYEPGFKQLWTIISSSDSVDTCNIQPFDGAQWKQYETMILKRDEAVARADAAVVYISVMLKLGALLLFFLWRTMMLPDWASVLLLNIPYTMIDEMAFLMLIMALIGPVKCKYSLLFFYEQWIKPYIDNVLDQAHSLGYSKIE